MNAKVWSADMTSPFFKRDDISKRQQNNYDISKEDEIELEC